MRLRRWAVFLVAVATVAAVAVVVGLRLAATPPPPHLEFDAPSSLLAAPGSPPPIPTPPQGSLLVEAAPGQRLAAVAADQVRPIASLAKVMTALVVLRTHPLAPGQAGPELTMTADDVSLFHDAVAHGGAALPVTPGERFSERDLLLGLLLPSANNFAETLARWVAGSHQAFVDRLNATAATLGMSHTHFDDPSGLSKDTMSTASDLVVLGRAALAEPVLAAIVATKEATLADGTALHNLDSLLGSAAGWLGIKTGETGDAGGCLLFAARRQPPDDLGGPAVTLVGAVLGQPRRDDALAAARAATDAAFGGFVTVRPATLTAPPAGDVTSAWGSPVRVHPEVDANAGAKESLSLLRGTVIQLSVSRPALKSPLHQGDQVGSVDGRLGAAFLVRWTIRLDADLPAPSPWWRIAHD